MDQNKNENANEKAIDPDEPCCNDCKCDLSEDGISFIEICHDCEMRRLFLLKDKNAEIERIAKLLEEAEADKKFLAERLKLRDGEVERLTHELEAVKEDFNEFGGDYALLESKNGELRGRIERAIAKEKDDHNKALENLDKSAKQNQHEWDGHGWIYSRTKVGMHAALDIIAALSNIHSSKIIEILEGKAKEGGP